MTPQLLTKEQAIQLLTRASYVIPDGYGASGEAVVHCFISPGWGMEWHVDRAIHAVNRARSVYWSEQVLRHNLVVVTEVGNSIRFDVGNNVPRTPKMTPNGVCDGEL